MGSTVTTGRTAAAFRASSGAIIYCLYEQTYEKNCFPHTPHWTAVYIGGAAGALRKVFSYASMCEGGMLQNRSGRITPEGYLRSWLSELQAPARMTRDHDIGLHAKTGSMYAPLTQKTLPVAAARLTAAGLHNAAIQLLATGKTSLSLFEHGELISRLRTDHDIPTWTLLPDCTRPLAGTERDASLGISAQKAISGIPRHPPALVVSQHGDMILHDADGAWRCQGWPYEIVGQYVQSLAGNEAGYPSNYCSLIRSFRDHLKAAVKADPKQLIVVIDKTRATDSWEIGKIEEAAALPDATTKGEFVSIPFSPEHEYTLCHLPRTATTWRVLDEGRSPLKPADMLQAVLA